MSIIYNKEILANLSYQIAQREISELEGVPNLWKTEKYCGNKLDVRISCGYGFGGYADWIHPDFKEGKHD